MNIIHSIKHRVLQKTALAAMLASAASFVANLSTAASVFWLFEEPKMPASLVKKQTTK